MKLRDFIDLLSERYAREEMNPDAEILVEDEGGLLHDFTVEETEEAFDGFETYYPAGLKIVINEK